MMHLWPVVHQAAGMVAVQLGVTADEALVRLRALAFAGDASILDTAEAVVDRQRRFRR
jgi:AmiR/NasT family two-component response regulator